MGGSPLLLLLFLVEVHEGLGDGAGGFVADLVLFDPADGHELHDAVGQEGFVGGEEGVDVDGLDAGGDVVGAGELEDGGAGDAGEDAAAG